MFPYKLYIVTTISFRYYIAGFEKIKLSVFHTIGISSIKLDYLVLTRILEQYLNKQYIIMSEFILTKAYNAGLLL